MLWPMVGESAAAKPTDLQAFHARDQRLVEVQFTIHGAFGNLRYFVVAIVDPRYLVDHLVDYQRRVHVHDHKPLIPPERALSLQRAVASELLLYLRERPLEYLDRRRLLCCAHSQQASAHSQQA